MGARGAGLTDGIVVIYILYPPVCQALNLAGQPPATGNFLAQEHQRALNAAAVLLDEEVQGLHESDARAEQRGQLADG